MPQQRRGRHNNMPVVQGAAGTPFAYMIRPTQNYRRKRNRYFEEEGKEVDYKDVSTLKKFTTDTGKIIGRRKTGLSAKYQRQVAEAIKRARYMALMPYAVKVKL